MWHFAAVIGLVAVLAFCPPAHAEVRYTVQDLGTLGGTLSEATAINAAGEVVGRANPPGAIDNRELHAFIFRDGKMIDLNTQFVAQFGAQFGGVDWPTATNSSCQVAVIGGVNGVGQRSYVWTNGTFTSLGSLGGTQLAVTALNNSGQAAGVATPSPDGPQVAFSYLDGQPAVIDLSSISKNLVFSTASGINNKGWIVGMCSALHENGSHAFLYKDGQVQDLGLGFSPSAINDAGLVVGADYHGSGGAALYQDGKMTIIGGGVATAVNNRGDVVGFEDVGGPGTAFIYSDGVRTDLNSLIDPNLGLWLQTARGINDAGQIAATAIFPGGVYRAYLLTPVPEPAELSGMLLGVTILLWRRRAA